ncbi:cytochrome d ubiquinol oxidase subunit II [Vitreoscilla massiliensis]|uniref:Cytochrome d ubiquinol oxidase subunit II n=1 Tax=Vitreoscilla massiliensis TaxID=1689272 RepID=A0ABY4E2G0_9NEIS|nr:cytochrome d ubiquinol oxidase subunit II [Vitreoscilla massiliensis]UOO89699.1 cytochrome d ubiquinol oxidase subunit II [Vitreoscilla massiliensis]
MEYELLRVIWWVLIGVLLIGFALTDGFDMGAMVVMPFVGKTDQQRRACINSIAPHWDGNQVWFITAGGALFAAWPLVYAVAFSGMYWALLLVLFALFLRPVGFDYRSKLDNTRWRTAWDWALCIGGAVPILVFGVAFGNLFLGVPFQLDELMRSTYHGSFWALLNPFALLCGIVSFAMLCAHGCSWLQMRTEKEVELRSQNLGKIFTAVYLLVFSVVGLWLAFGNIEGYAITSAIDGNAPINPLGKVVAASNHGWMNNYSTYPAFMLAPVLAYVGALLALLGFIKSKSGVSFLGTSIMIIGTILTAGFALFPFLLPSSLDMASSLTMWDATASHLTLTVMFVVACIFVPLILIYTLWSYVKMWGRIHSHDIDANPHGLY